MARMKYELMDTGEYIEEDEYIEEEIENTEKFCVFEIGENKYHNKIFNFTGTMSECRAFESSNRFGGGVEILKKENK